MSGRVLCRRFSRAPEIAGELREPVAGAKTIFVVPAHSCDDALLALLRPDGGFFGERPEIWSWPELYRQFVPPAALRRQVDPPDHRLILRHIVREELSECEERGVSVPAGASRPGFIEILSEAIRELLLEGVEPDMILGGDAGPASALAAPDLLHRMYFAYCDYLEKNGLADNSQLPTLTAGGMDRGEAAAFLARHELRWVGFLSFTGAQRRLFLALAGLVAAPRVMRLYVPEACLDGFEDAALQALGRDAPPRKDGAFVGRVVEITSRDIFSQYDDAAREIANIAAGESVMASAFGEPGPAPDIAALTAPGRGDLLAAALGRLGVPYVLQRETSARETPVFEAARSAWDAYRAGWPLERTLALLSSPILGIEPPPAAKAFERMPDGEDGWLSFLGGLEDKRPLAAFQRFAEFCGFVDCEGEDGRTAGELLRELLSLSEGWGEAAAREAGDSTELDPAVRACLGVRTEIERKLEQIEELAPSLGEAGAQLFAGAEAMRFLADWAAEAATPLPQPLAGAVTIYEATPPVLVSHDIWVMTDADASRYPGSITDHALLDQTVRERVNGAADDRCAAPDSGEPPRDAVHLPSLQEKRRQKEALFRRLLCVGTRGTVLVRSLLDERGRKQERGSYFADALFHDAAADWKKLFVIRSESSIASIPAVGRGEFPRKSPPFAAERVKVSASGFDRWFTCRYRCWLEREAMLRDERLAAASDDFMTIGSAAHDIWQQLWARYGELRASGGRPTLEGLLADGWAGFVREMKCVSPFPPDGRAAVAERKLKSRMMISAAAQDAAEARAASLGLVRERTDFELALPAYETGRAKFVGRADRIDYWRGLGAVIADYKAGDAGNYLKKSRQLDCYAVMLRADGVNVGGWCYIGQAKGDIAGLWKNPDLAYIYTGKNEDVTGEGSFSARADDTEERMRELGASLGIGREPANYDRDICRGCGYTQICRRGESVGEGAGGTNDGEGDESDE